MFPSALRRPTLRRAALAGALVAAVILRVEVPRRAESELQAAIAAAAARDPEREALQNLTVVLDAGHGGQDGGTAGHGIQEKDATLDLARRTAKELRRWGIQVRMTRESDTYVELEERCAVAAKSGAAALVSIHLNASSARSVSGIETYFCSQRARLQPVRLAALEDHRSELLAASIQRRACRATGSPDRGARDSRLYVVLHAACPAVLVECGYLTHAAEARRLKRDDHRDALARAVAEGVRRYLIATAFNPRRGFTVPSAGREVAAGGS
jgi:N-acetylmuramoyl-L-alanine amidase